VKLIRKIAIPKNILKIHKTHKLYTSWFGQL
jgi:hypothetical protein